MAKTSKELRKWRKKQKPGAIMKSSTFDKIVREKMAEGFSRERAEKMAGEAYWNAVRAKYREHHKRKKKK